MEIKELYLGHFGKFEKKEIQLGSGINVIQGANEAGKSTVHSFIRGMFFGIEKRRGREAKGDLYGKYQPWETPGAYQGSMIVEKNGTQYQITRNFLQKERSVSIIDRTTGRELTERELAGNGELEHFNETVYRNTISIEQLKAATEKEFAAELQNYIANLSMARSNEVDIAGALQRLKEKKKSFDTAAMERELVTVQEQISEQEEKVARQDALAMELQELVAEQKQLQEAWSEQTGELQQNPAADIERLMDRYQQYEQRKQELAAAEGAGKALQERLARISVEGADSTTLEADCRRFEQLRTEQQALERGERQELAGKAAEIEKQGRNKCRECVAVGAAAAILAIVFAALAMWAGAIAGAVLAIVAVVFYQKFNVEYKARLRGLQEQQSELAAELARLEGMQQEILQRNLTAGIEALYQKLHVRVAEEAECSQLRERLEEQRLECERRTGQTQSLAEEVLGCCRILGLKLMEISQVSKELLQELTGNIQARYRREQEALEQKRSREEELRSREEYIRWELNTLDGVVVILEEKKKEAKELQQTIAEYTAESEAIDAAMEAIKTLSADIHDSFGESLNRSISAKVNEITAGKYSGIVMDEQMAVKVVSKNGYIPLEKLSAGTNCQVYLAVRMAMAELFFGSQTMPLLFDDTFALYDDERTAAALAYLAGTGRQILIFTCHTREARILAQAGIEYTLVAL